MRWKPIWMSFLRKLGGNSGANEDGLCSNSLPSKNLALKRAERTKPMEIQGPVKIPDIPGRISFSKIEGKEYVRYQTDRKYNADKKYNEPERVMIGRRCESMPGLMYPNENYERLFVTNESEENVNETMTPEEEKFARDNKTYGMYAPFFDALYHEFRQQTRKRPDELLNTYKAETLNKVLRPLREMMQGEEYAGLLGFAIAGDEEGNGMTFGDVMILLTQYKSALTKYRRAHR